MKYIQYGYFIITLIVSTCIQWGAQTFLEFIGTTLLTFIFFCGIFLSFKGISKVKLSIKIFRGLCILLCLALLSIISLYALMRQFSSPGNCLTGSVGQNLITKEYKDYCNFVPWYAKRISKLMPPTTH